MKKQFTVLILLSILAFGCTENYSNGERIGLITQFSHKGLFWKSWEGQLNLTQTGMNSSGTEPFSFSLDNENENPMVKMKIDSATNFGWKVKLVYHESKGKNWFDNRGNTNHFIDECIILDKNPIGDLFKNKLDPSSFTKVHDTIYLVIYKEKK